MKWQKADNGAAIKPWSIERKEDGLHITFRAKPDDDRGPVPITLIMSDHEARLIAHDLLSASK